MPADFIVSDNGSLWLFTPMTPPAATHLDMVLAENRAAGEAPVRFGPGVAVEARMGLAFGRTLQADGFSLAKPGDAAP